MNIDLTYLWFLVHQRILEALLCALTLIESICHFFCDCFHMKYILYVCLNFTFISFKGPAYVSESQYPSASFVI